MKFKSPILKLALFATGLSGIVAEYILSTLATYFLGDSAVQWALIVSVMLFSMGLGSRLSQYIKTNLLVKFVYIEFLLSVLVALSSLVTYILSGFVDYIGIIIYAMSIIIGILIGMEIPLVIRLNKQFQELRINVASVMEKDYWGSLVGGLFFAFVGLPYLGLTYTPFILGAINFSVAILLFVIVYRSLERRKLLPILTSALITLAFLIAGVTYAKPLILYGEQKRYADKVIFAKQTAYQRVVVTQWKDDYWLYINGNQQLSTLDEEMYHEPLVHPAMQTGIPKRNVLVLGGGDGCAVREILKYPSVEQVTVVDLDSVLTNLGRQHPVFTELNNNALNNPKVEILNRDAFQYLEKTQQFFDAIIIDLPDPRTVELNRLYSREFYTFCRKAMRPGGTIVTQAGSPYFATKAYYSINKTLAAAGFETAMLHNHVITLGEWGWVLGLKTSHKTDLKSRLQMLKFEAISTRWINNEAMQMMTSFGKDIYAADTADVEINKIHDPVLYRYYLDGNWDLY